MSTIIHIGYPKTATTWFKKYFYPYVANATTVSSDNIDFKQGSKIRIINLPETDIKRHRIIVSHKFSGLVDFRWENGKYRKYFAPELKKSFPEAKIVIFLRNQTDFLSSAYSSYLTHGGTYTFKNMYNAGKLIDGQMFSFEYLDYNAIIEQYSKYFGKNNVYVFLYEDFLADKKQFIENYIKIFNLDIDINAVSLQKYNTKLRKGLAAFIRFSNMFSLKGVKPKKYLINAPFLFSWLDNKLIIKINKMKIWGGFLDNETVLGKELIEKIYEYYKQPNRELLKYESCKSIKKYGYPL